MGCHIEIPQHGPFNGSTVFICGEAIDPPAKLCKFCGEDGLYLCDWKEVERVEQTHWHDVRVGDVWVTNQRPWEPVTNYIQAVVVEIVAVERGLNFIVQSPKGRQPYFRFFNSVSPCPILRRGTCDQPMCERHAREVGDDVHYCMDCWRRQAALIGASR